MQKKHIGGEFMKDFNRHGLEFHRDAVLKVSVLAPDSCTYHSQEHETVCVYSEEEGSILGIEVGGP